MSESHPSDGRQSDQANANPPAKSASPSPPLVQLVLARLREFYREPEAVFWVYGFPILMVVALGIAFRSRPVERVRVDVLAESSESPEFLAVKNALASRPEPFDVAAHDAASCAVRLRTGKVDLTVEPKGAGSDGTPAYSFRHDANRPESVLAGHMVRAALEAAAGRKDLLAVEESTLEETGARYIDRLVPGLLGMSLMGGGLWGVGFAVVDMRIRKLLKRFLATPMRKRDYLLGIMISRLVFLIPEVLVLLLFSRIAFKVVIHGSLLSLVAMILLGAFSFAGIGLLVASRAKTIEAVSGLMNLVMLPMWMLSGVFFSSERFPEAAQPFIKALPLTPLVDALRAISLDGASLADQAGRIAILAAWGVISFVLALKLFRWN